MSFVRSLALVLTSAAVLAAPVVSYAQARIPVRPAPVRVAPVRPAAPARPPVVVRPNSGTPTAIPSRPVPKTDPDPGINRERLRNACFNSPNPPMPLCRRVFGN